MEACSSPGNCLCQGAFASLRVLLNKPKSSKFSSQKCIKPVSRPSSIFCSITSDHWNDEKNLKRNYPNTALKIKQTKKRTPITTNFHCVLTLAGSTGLWLAVSRCKETDHKLIGRTHDVLYTSTPLWELLCPPASSHKHWSVFFLKKCVNHSQSNRKLIPLAEVNSSAGQE